MWCVQNDFIEKVYFCRPYCTWRMIFGSKLLEYLCWKIALSLYMDGGIFGAEYFPLTHLASLCEFVSSIYMNGITGQNPLGAPCITYVLVHVVIIHAWCHIYDILSFHFNTFFSVLFFFYSSGLSRLYNINTETIRNIKSLRKIVYWNIFYLHVLFIITSWIRCFKIVKLH